MDCNPETKRRHVQCIEKDNRNTLLPDQKRDSFNEDTEK